MSLDPENSEWLFFQGVDSADFDLKYVGKKPINELLTIASNEPECLCFNTLGFLKNNITLPLVHSKYFTSDDGVFVKRTEYEQKLKLKNTNKTIIKLMCNWTTSSELCKEWAHMSQAKRCELFPYWNNIEFTSSNIADFYIIINKPLPNEYYNPSRTIIFHMEPWCGNENQTWGVKTWGEWANPSIEKFLQVRNHDNYINNCLWQLSTTYTEFKTNKIEKNPEYGNLFSTICSSKYFDPGHKLRLDFLKYIENKNDPILQFHLYNSDNNHNFKSYKGRANVGIDKEKGIMPYKYYFMCENNVEHNFLTEKLWEPIICETLCFYWGCPNVTDYIDYRAFVLLDMSDFEKSFNIMKEAIENNLWEMRLPYIKAEKQRILDYYNFYPTVERILYKDFGFSIHPTDEEITYKKTIHYLVKNQEINIPRTFSETPTICFIHSTNNEPYFTKKLDSILETLYNSEVYYLFDLIVINNHGKNIDKEEYTQRYKNNNLIIINNDDTNLGEVPTLKLIKYFSDSITFNTKILYLFTKDNTYSNKNIDCWVKYMLYFLVKNGKNCINELEEYDSVGVNYHNKPCKHWSGNFWWANSNYIKQLRLDNLKTKDDPEKWVLSVENVKTKEIHNSGVDHFVYSYLPIHYISGPRGEDEEDKEEEK